MTPVESRRLGRAVRGALLRRELAESRPAIIAGGVIFLGMPILWAVLYVAIDYRHETLPGAANVATAGWRLAIQRCYRGPECGAGFGAAAGGFSPGQAGEDG